jgi:hypothetical protein
MKRMFWLGVGIAAGVLVTRKASGAARRLTPAGIGEQLGDGLRELAAALGSFGADVRAGMAEREHELTDMVERRTGQRLPGLATTPGPVNTPGPTSTRALRAAERR